MKRLILLLFSAMACAQTFTVSGHVVNPNTGVPTGMTITFSLINTGTQQCKVSGTGLIVPNNQVFTPDGTGTISGTLYRNDFIVCGSSSNTQWQYQILGPGVSMPKCALAAVTTTSLNVDSAACTNTVPVVTPPTGDTTYCRIDGSNCGFTGNVTFNSHNITGVGAATITGALTVGSPSITASTIEGTMEVDQKCTTPGVYDQTCFTNAFAAATQRQKLHVAAHTYNLSGSGAEILLQTIPLYVDCDPSAVLLVAVTVPNTTDIWHWKPGAANLTNWRLSHCHISYTNGASQSITAATNATPIQITIAGHGYVTGNVVTCAGIGGNTTANGTYTITKVDANNFTENGSSGLAAYTSGGTCALVPGGYGLHLDTTNGNQISTFNIEENTFDQGGKPAMFFDNTGANANGIFTGEIRNNFVKGGFTSVRMGDSVAFVDNRTAGGFDGFIVDTIGQESRFMGNNITNQGCAFRITNGNWLRFQNNNAEPDASGTQGGPDSTNCANNAVFDIVCSVATPCFGFDIFDNTISASSVSASNGPQNAFRCDGCTQAFFHHNNSGLAFAGQKEYVFTANSKYSRAWINRNIAATTCTSRMTDAGLGNTMFCDDQSQGSFEVGTTGSPSNGFNVRAGSAQVVSQDILGVFQNGGTGILEVNGNGNVIIGGGANNGNILEVTGGMTITGNPRSNSAGVSTLGISTFPWNSVYIGTNGFSSQITGTTTAARTVTLPDASITLNGAIFTNCGTSAACSATTESSTVKVVRGSAALVSGTPSQVTITAISPAFTSSSSYFCTVTPQGATSAIAAAGVAISYVSGTSFTLTGPTTVTTVMNYICIGT